MLDNVGREGHTYCTYIYENYDHLADYTIFLQGRSNDHSPNVISNINAYINNVSLNIGFEFLSEHIVHSSFDLESRINVRCLNIHANYEKVFGTKIENDECIFGAGAQFIISKQSILKHTKEFYKNIVNMLGYTTDPPEGHDIERFHKYIFS